MRKLFIRSLDVLITTVVVGQIIGVIILSVVAYAGNGIVGPVTNAINGGGIVSSLLVLSIGLFFVIVIGGTMFLGLGIYHNTQRSAYNTRRAEGAIKMLMKK